MINNNQTKLKFKAYSLRATSILIIFFLSCLNGFAQTSNLNKVAVPQVLNEVSVEMKPIKITPKGFNIPNEGGHLQGVQYFESNGNQYLVASGSSFSTAYYFVALLTDSGNTIVHYKPIAELPFKHAGGIQMYQQYLFVGVEDDVSKMKSQIHVYDLSEPGVSDSSPLYIIDRSGNFKEKTAGAVGVTMFEGQLIMAVASWDSETIDFYRSNMKPLNSPSFAMQLVSTWRDTKADRSEWSSKWWYSYQNINLFVGTNDTIYLAGFAKHKDGNFMEVFSCSFNEGKVALIKEYAKQFYCVKGANFRNGGGIIALPDNKILVLAISKKVSGKIMVNWFGPKT